METRKKKSFKRLFAFLMAFVMVTTLAVSAVFAAPTFKDVPADHDFYDEIEDLAAKGYVGGYGTTGLFKPEEKLTRAQAAKVIALAAGYEAPAGFKSKLTDIDSNVDMYEHIWALEKAGIVKGFGKSNEFRPDENITRGHVAKMVAMAFELEEGDVDFAFTDLPTDDEVVKEAIEILASNGIVSGYGTTGLFKPDELVTRGQFAKMVSRAIAVAEDQAALEVVDVKAINGRKLEVAFSGKVDQTEATTSAKYSVVKKDGTAVNFATPVFDTVGKKTVTLKLISALNGEYLITVQPIKAEGTGTAKTPLYSKTLIFSDTVRPEVKEVTYSAIGKAEIVFTEELSTAGTVVISPALGSSPTLNEDELEFTGLVDDKEYTVTITGAKDMSENLITPNPTVVKLKNTLKSGDQVKPVLESVVADGLNGVILTFSEEVVLTTISISLDGTIQTGAASFVDATKNKLEVYAPFNAAVAAGAHTVKVADDFEDLAGNKGVGATKTLQFAAPVAKLVKTEVASDDKSVALTFDINVTKVASATVDLTYVHELITYAESGVTLSTSGKVLTLAKSDSSAFEPGVYTGTLKSTHLNELGATDTVAIAFTILDPAAPTVKAIPSVEGEIDKDYATIVYKDKDGNPVKMGASALDVANYKVEGVNVFSSAIFDAANNKVKLTLKPGSILQDGDYQLTISASVKTYVGVAIDAFTGTETFKENVAPTVISAEFVAPNKVKLTFSEPVMADASFASVKLDGETEGTFGEIASHVAVAEVTLSEAAYSLADVFTVVFDVTKTVQDANGNKLVPAASYAVAMP